ncbi:hypothetical protein HAX54_031016 [Datura stramonium]|uniref:FH2 domain-containing protein n=1 Tax=Datura stramonium TaxID=4076 RepID=A0ABS8RL25_DATST|nr:hypothetical protein [Datura stramonium]
MEIMLTKVKMPLPDMMVKKNSSDKGKLPGHAAALAMDESVLDADQVENLIKFCPTKEEMDLLKEERLVNKASSLNFPVFTQGIEYGYIFYLFGLVLAIGFKLDSLLKLTDTRATNNRMTLMHYLCKVLASKSPTLLDFHEGLVSMEAASKIQLKSLAEEMQAIIKGLEKVKKELESSESDGPVSEVFCKTLKEFIGASEAEVGSLRELYSVAGRNADALALYFNEDPAKCPFEQVTATLLNFVRLFRKAHEENLKQAEQDKKKVQKEAEAENAEGSSSKNKGEK